MRRIDPEGWPRASVYRWYRQMDLPWVGVTAEADVTGTVTRAKGAGDSLFGALMHRLALAANQVPALRQRIRIDDSGEWVAEHERVDPAYTVAVDGELFNYTTTALTDDVGDFARAVASASAEQRDNTELAPFDGHRDDVLYMTCLPWIRFTDMTHPMHSGRVDSVPRIAWGKLVSSQGRWTCPVNIQAHHALVDGVHLGQFFSAVEAQ